MTAIRKRTTIHATGTPEGLASALDARPEGVPHDAVIVDVQLRTEHRSSLAVRDEQIDHSYIAITLEWPA